MRIWSRLTIPDALSSLSWGRAWVPIYRQGPPAPSTTCVSVQRLSFLRSPGSAGSTLESPRLAAKHQHQQWGSLTEKHHADKLYIRVCPPFLFCAVFEARRRRLSDEDFKGPVQRVAHGTQDAEGEALQRSFAKEPRPLSTD